MEQKEALVQCIMYNRSTGDKIKISKKDYDSLVSKLSHSVKVANVKRIINGL